MSLTDCINLILFALIQYNKTPVKPPFYRHFTGFLQFYWRSVKQLKFKDVLEIIGDKPRKIVVFVTNVSLTVHIYYFLPMLFSVDFALLFLHDSDLDCFDSFPESDRTTCESGSYPTSPAYGLDMCPILEFVAFR